jgi:hypothetical protein
MNVATLIDILRSQPQDAEVRLVAADMGVGGDVHNELTDVRLVRRNLVVMGAMEALCSTDSSTWISRYEANKQRK